MHRFVALCTAAIALGLALEAAAVGPGDVAPDFTLEDVDGNSIALSNYRGRVVLLALIGYGWIQCNAAGPDVERIWQDFKERNFQALALDCWNGSLLQVQSFIENTGITFPVLRNAGYLQAPSLYGVRYDNYFVIDAGGIVRYTSVRETPGSKGTFDDAHIRAAIQLALPVQNQTWSGVKALYR